MTYRHIDMGVCCGDEATYRKHELWQQAKYVHTYTDRHRDIQWPSIKYVCDMEMRNVQITQIHYISAVVSIDFF